MRVQVFPPSAPLAPFVKSLTVVETAGEATRTLIPETGVVVGIRYGGSATQLDGAAPRLLPGNTIAGLRSAARRMRTAAGGGAVFAAFREGGAAHFFHEPLHELFGATLALEDLAPRTEIDRLSMQIAEANEPRVRLALLEQFLLARQRSRTPDPVVAAAVRALQASHGTIRIAALARVLGISQDALEKRFRRVVGASPKQLARTLRVRHAIASYRPGTSLTELSFRAGYFDQSHFIREIRSVTGEPPRLFFRGGEHC